MKLLVMPAVMTLSVMMSGCASWWHKPPPPPSPSADVKYEQLDLGSLVLFSGDIIRMPQSERMSECSHLKGLIKRNPLLAFRLHLAAVQTITEACGSLEETSGLLRSSKSEIRDASVLSWVSFLEEVVVTLQSERASRKAAEGNVKKVRATAKRSQRVAKSKESELKALQNKLDALKSIEQSLGGSQEEQ